MKPPTIISVISFNVCGQLKLYNVLTTREEILTALDSPFSAILDLRKALMGYEEIVVDALENNDSFNLFLTTGNDVFFVGDMNYHEDVMLAIDEYVKSPATNKIPVNLIRGYHR